MSPRPECVVSCAPGIQSGEFWLGGGSAPNSTLAPPPQVALPLPKPNAPLEKGKDQYKIQLSFDGEFPSGHTIRWGWLGAFLLLSRLRFVLPLIIFFSYTVR